MPAIHFLDHHKTVDVLPGANLRKAALKAGVGLYPPLRRLFSLNVEMGPIKIPCRSDVVEVVDGKGVNPRTREEEQWITGRVFKRKVGPQHRLACQVQVHGDISIRMVRNLVLDREETKRSLGYLAALGIFALLMAVTFGVMALDLIKAL
ncbi:MAG: hypothetical protein HBSIN02_17750 [Bacteroidia bacterium]|nr:MAG: hypothetical protein HBSIN02_17750 [Bacteroidia bacterium]